MLFDAVSLALLTTGGFYLVYQKLPRKIRRFLEKHSLMTDLIALVLTYMLMGSTLTALLAGAMVGIFTSILLHIANNQQDFLYLFDFQDTVRDQLEKVKVYLSQKGQEYREFKEKSNVGEKPAIN